MERLDRALSKRQFLGSTAALFAASQRYSSAQAPDASCNRSSPCARPVGRGASAHRGPSGRGSPSLPDYLFRSFSISCGRGRCTSTVSFRSDVEDVYDHYR
jgi:hypothetical protein